MFMVQYSCKCVDDGGWLVCRGGVLLLQIGDKVVYPMHGAGVISGIENCEVLGEGKSYYVLEMPLGNMKVMIPTDNADNVGLRDVIPQH